MAYGLPVFFIWEFRVHSLRFFCIAGLDWCEKVCLCHENVLCSGTYINYFTEEICTAVSKVFPVEVSRSRLVLFPVQCFRFERQFHFILLILQVARCCA